MPYKDRELHREQIRADARRWCAAHREQRRLAAIAHRAAGPENSRATVKRWQAKNREQIRLRDNALYASQPDIRLNRNAIRRAKTRGVAVERVDRSIVFKRDGGICGICNLPANPESWHLDHVIPLARGGAHSYANTQVTHPVCNLRKGVRLGRQRAA